jgi:hypothetical protein
MESKIKIKTKKYNFKGNDPHCSLSGAKCT